MFDDVVGYHRGITLLRDGNDIHQVYATSVTSNAFEFYGVPALARARHYPRRWNGQIFARICNELQDMEGRVPFRPSDCGKDFYRRRHSAIAYRNHASAIQAYARCDKFGR